MSRNNNPRLVSPAQTLTELRNHLIRLHKTLLDIERRSYERMNGRISSPGRFFELVVSDEWFAWLHPISELIVKIDETLADEGELEESEAQLTLQKAEELLTPGEMGTTFERRYYEALQLEPAVVMAHAAAVRVIRDANPSPEE